MEPWLDCGNPSSVHEEGRRARQAIDQAREQVSQALRCLFAEVIFTSSGTEAANLAILGCALANQDRRRARFVFSAVEHHCVLNTAPLLERLGYRVDLASVDRSGRLVLDTLPELVADDVLMVCVMQANNELGTLQPVAETSRLAHEAGALYFCDAIQNSLSLRLDDFHPDLLCLSAHKLYGPKGAGALYVKAGTKLKPISVGGGQERELRAGTENVAAIAGFGAALSPHSLVFSRRNAPVHEGSPSRETEEGGRGVEPRPPRDLFLDRLLANGFAATVLDRTATLPGHAHVRLPGVDAETMLIRLDRMGIGASSGAACSSGSLEPSHVLKACGYSEREAREGLRFTFGRDSTGEDAEEAASRVVEAASILRR